MDDGYKQSAASSRMMLPLLFVLLYAAFQGAVAESSGQPPSMKKSAQFMAPNRLGSSVVFPLSGNVYPLGYVLKLGNAVRSLLLSFLLASGLLFFCMTSCFRTSFCFTV